MFIRPKIEYPDDRMITSVNKAAQKQHYSRWLKERMIELCISQSQLARSVGRSQKEISRYINEEALPPNDIADKIAVYIIESSIAEKFYHLGEKKFSMLLDRLLNESRASQQTLATAIGKTQKDISNFCHADTNTYISVQTQHDILS